MRNKIKSWQFKPSFLLCSFKSSLKEVAEINHLWNFQLSTPSLPGKAWEG